MSRWHRENPEHYEQFGEPDWLGAADMERKRQREEPDEQCQHRWGRHEYASAATYPHFIPYYTQRCERCGMERMVS